MLRAWALVKNGSDPRPNDAPKQLQHLAAIKQTTLFPTRMVSIITRRTTHQMTIFDTVLRKSWRKRQRVFVRSLHTGKERQGS
jgi:hypothetical protein